MKSLLKFQLRLTLNCLLVLLIAVPAQAADRITYYHNDALGSPVAATSQTGQLLWRESYRPYGERLTVAPASANNHTWFTGKQEESALGISYFGARWYLPSAGRFLSRDPAPATAENIHSFNRYAYANNNPYKFVDPNGKWVVPIILGVGAYLATNNAQAPTSAADIHPNMDVRTVEAISAAAGLVGLANTIRAIAAEGAGEGLTAGAASKYENITRPGSKLPNYETNVTKSDFEKNLLDNGFTKSTSRDGNANIFTSGDRKYTTRDFSKSTDGPAVEVFIGKDAVSKIRLGGY